MLNEDNPDELSPEAELAMQTALNVLSAGRDDDRPSVTPPSLVVPVSALDGPRDQTLTPSVAAVTRSVAGDEIAIRRIRSRSAIPLEEMHVVVMWGLSTYRAEHPRGVTLVVDNSRDNVERDFQYKEAMLAAKQLAQSKGLQFVYELE
jgi:hypothetical protein